MKTTYTDKPSFFRWVNSYEGELVIKKNQIYNDNGELLCEFNNGNEQNILNAVKHKNKVHKALVSYFTELAKSTLYINTACKLVFKDNIAYYEDQTGIAKPIQDLTLNELFTIGTIFN